MKFGDNICNFISPFRSPNLSLEEFGTFTDNFEFKLDVIAQKNPFSIVLLGNLYAKLSNLYKNDTTSYKCTKIDGMTSQFGMQQLINEPIHILPELSSCIDLNFVSQTSFVIESLCQKYDHQKICAKLNLKIHHPSPYEREIWHYNYASIDLIRRAINYYLWARFLAEKDATKRSIYLLKQLKMSSQFFSTLSNFL